MMILVDIGAGVTMIAKEGQVQLELPEECRFCKYNAYDYHPECAVLETTFLIWALEDHAKNTCGFKNKYKGK